MARADRLEEDGRGPKSFLKGKRKKERKKKARGSYRWRGEENRRGLEGRRERERQREKGRGRVKGDGENVTFYLVESRETEEARASAFAGGSRRSKKRSGKDKEWEREG